MYKDKLKQKEANRKASKRYRGKGMTQGMTGGGYDANQGMTVTPIKPTDLTRGMMNYPDILDKLTDPTWRKKLEKICYAFKSSHHPSYIKEVWLGDYNMGEVCELLEVTR